MQDAPTAAALALRLPRSKKDYAQEDFRKESDWLMTTGDEAAERARAKDPDAEFVSMSASGQVEVATGEEIDREMVADGYRPYEREVTTQRRAAPVIRRTMTRARSSLRSGRPASRRTSSRASASSGDPDLPEPPPPIGGLSLLAGRTRLLCDSATRIGAR